LRSILSENSQYRSSPALRLVGLFLKSVHLKQPRQFCTGLLGGLHHFGCIVVDRVLGGEDLQVVVLEPGNARIGLGLAQA